MRYANLARTIDDAIVGESARWGDYRRDVHQYKTGPYELYTRDDHWRPEVKRLIETYFPKRSDIFLKQLKTAGLFSRIPAPRSETRDSRLVLVADQGDVFFTLDGTDPRLTGGKINPIAQPYFAPVAKTGDVRLKARARSRLGGKVEWSSIVEF